MRIFACDVEQRSASIISPKIEHVTVAKVLGDGHARGATAVVVGSAQNAEVQD